MMGMRNLGLPATIVFLLVMPRGLNAASVIIEVKPEAAEVHGFKFRIVKEKDDGKEITFSASISEVGTKRCTRPSVGLGIVKTEGHVKSIETSQTLRPKRLKDGLAFTFTASKASVKDRRFCLIFTNFVELEVDGEIVPMPSADFYIMRLHDFTKHPAPSASSKTSSDEES